MTPNNKTALITGASSGIGYELAKLFAKDNYSLIIVARSEENLNKVAQEFKQLGSPQVIIIAKDLSKDGAANELYLETQNKGINIDVLVNDAGVGERGLFVDTPIEKDMEIIHLNVVSLVHLSKLYLRDMVKKGNGKVLQLASEAAYSPTPLLAVYSATKAFVLWFTDSLINELKDTGVTMTALIPGATDTDFFNKAHAENTVAAINDPYDPAFVAKTGYEALMKGEHHAVAGAKTRAHVAMGTFMPNEAVTATARKQMEEKES